MASRANRVVIGGGWTSLLVAGAVALVLAGCGGGTSHRRSTLPLRTRRPASESNVLQLAAELTADYRQAPAVEQTRPVVRPSTGGIKGTFAVHLSIGRRLGPHGLTSTDYKIVAGGRNPRCAIFTFVEVARAGAHVVADLHPPLTIGSWCSGTHRGVVLLQTNPYCPPPTPTKPQRCRLFATRLMDAGRFKFSVR
jgi:hypothetical protein